MYPKLATARSWLFVPGASPRRFQKARDSGADCIVLDLEDAVAPADKLTARAHVDEWLAGGNVGAVRINAPDTPWHSDDLKMVRRRSCPVMIPKVTSANDVSTIQARLPSGTPLIPLIESATAVLAAATICAQPGVVRAAFGSFDLGTELGVSPENQMSFLLARSALVLGAAAAGIAPPIDGVTGDVASTAVLKVDVKHARELGFGGKLCIHPSQVSHVNSGFAPTDEEVRWAQRVLAHATAGGVTVLDGKMIDAPVVARAHRIATAGGQR